jgi:hypothetical protein
LISEAAEDLNSIFLSYCGRWEGVPLTKSEIKLRRGCYRLSIWFRKWSIRSISRQFYPLKLKKKFPSSHNYFLLCSLLARLFNGRVFFHFPIVWFHPADPATMFAIDGTLWLNLRYLPYWSSNTVFEETRLCNVESLGKNLKMRIKLSPTACDFETSVVGFLRQPLRCSEKC